jgi:hypothetical protein
MGYYDEKFTALNGKTVREIWMSDDYLTFVTDDGKVTYAVYGDCCSDSAFFDFYGVENVLGREVVAFESVSLSPGDPGYRAETFETPANDYGETQVYGYRITTEHPMFGHVSAVMSFRNESNGYYGGWMELTDYEPTYLPECQLLTDKVG